MIAKFGLNYLTDLAIFQRERRFREWLDHHIGTEKPQITAFTGRAFVLRIGFGQRGKIDARFCLRQQRICLGANRLLAGVVRILRHFKQDMTCFALLGNDVLGFVLFKVLFDLSRINNDLYRQCIRVQYHVLHFGRFAGFKQARIIFVVLFQLLVAGLYLRREIVGLKGPLAHLARFFLQRLHSVDDGVGNNAGLCDRLWYCL